MITTKATAHCDGIAANNYTCESSCEIEIRVWEDRYTDYTSQGLEIEDFKYTNTSVHIKPDDWNVEIKSARCPICIAQDKQWTADVLKRDALRRNQ